MERLYWGVMHFLMPLIFLALPCTVVSIICGVLGVARRSRALLVAAASCSVPMFLYILAGEAWWRPIVPVIIAMYFTAAYAVPKRRLLAATLVAPYFVFLAMFVNALWFQHSEPYGGAVEWRINGGDSR